MCCVANSLVKWPQNSLFRLFATNNSIHLLASKELVSWHKIGMKSNKYMPWGYLTKKKSGFKAVETKKYNGNQHNAEYWRNLALSPAPISAPNPLKGNQRILTYFYMQTTFSWCSACCNVYYMSKQLNCSSPCIEEIPADVEHLRTHPKFIYMLSDSMLCLIKNTK